MSESVSGSIPARVKFFFVINILYDCWLLKSIKKIIPLLRCKNKAIHFIFNYYLEQFCERWWFSLRFQSTHIPLMIEITIEIVTKIVRTVFDLKRKASTRIPLRQFSWRFQSAIFTIEIVKMYSTTQLFVIEIVSNDVIISNAPPTP